ncbi:YdbH domain-containing protein [Pseudoalteromonas sp. NEC-BIFX-2020_015]|uniref:intermembrane phospholipid transport protein YdbH family protein n=1 Tax=Pseudoalteromonas sp. NEC-BIFX-2020_015 TaxID=2729544 RepID=UPI0014615D5F|nr:YdbH domain-containing protein [Pseudoalteromonas sp. NEC-BIFX-2020_015]NMR24514.1 YdbH domain-containing protein [Pseudoalteromonas sp. NEC-BIFX-2020_015]
MLKRVGWGLLVLLMSVITLGYVFRMPITLHFIAPTLSSSGVELHCLDWSLTTKLDLHVQRACVIYQGQQLELADITVNTQYITIDRANLILSNSDTSTESSTAKKLVLALPQSRPLLHINRLEITQAQLQKPLTLSINESVINEFFVAGDVKADVKITKTKVSGHIELNDTLLTKMKATTANSLAGLNFTSQHSFTFDGIELKLKSKLDAGFSSVIDSCPMTVKSNGDVSSYYHLNTKLINVDAQQLTSTFNAKNECLQGLNGVITNPAQQQFIADQIPLSWQLTLPNKITLQGTQLTANELTLQGESHVQMRIQQLAVDINSALETLSAQVDLLFTSDDITQLKIAANTSNNHVDGNFQLKMATLPDFIAVDLQKVNTQGHFLISNALGEQPKVELSAELALAQLKVDDILLDNYHATLKAKLQSDQYLTASLSSKLDIVKVGSIKLTQLTNQLTAAGSLSVGELFFDLTSETKLAMLQSDEFKFKNIRISSQGLQSRALQASHHIFIDGIELVASHNMSSTAHPFEVIISDQLVTKLNPLLHQFEPLATLTDGTISGRITGDINLQQADISLQVTGVSGLYTDYLAKQLNTQFMGRYDSGQLNVEPTTFELNELRAGAVVEQLNGYWQVQENVPALLNVSGNVMGGHFLLDEYRLTNQPQQALVKFDNIDASKLITLDEKSGISLTGRVAGQLPVYFTDAGIEVRGGELVNKGTAKLLITDNAAFNAVKDQQQELGPVLGLLEDLDIKKINSSVNLKPDGWMTLGVNLQGYNQQQAQQVNFNYNHEENVFTLLRALRLSDEITQKVEQEYSTKGSKND